MKLADWISRAIVMKPNGPIEDQINPPKDWLIKNIKFEARKYRLVLVPSRSLFKAM